MSKKTYQQILTPDDEFNRTAALRELWDDVKSAPATDLSDELVSFLLSYETQDPIQAALIGMVLFTIGEGDTDAAYARMFLILNNPMHPDLESEARKIMAGHDIFKLYERVTNLALHADPGSADHHYGFLVLSGLDPDKLG